MMDSTSFLFQDILTRLLGLKEVRNYRQKKKTPLGSWSLMRLIERRITNEECVRPWPGQSKVPLC